MSIFNLFKKKKPNKKTELVPVETKSKNEKTSKTVSNEVTLTLHPDLKGLVWIGDGKYKNYELPPPKNI